MLATLRDFFVASIVVVAIYFACLANEPVHWHQAFTVTSHTAGVVHHVELP